MKTFTIIDLTIIVECNKCEEKLDFEYTLEYKVTNEIVENDFNKKHKCYKENNNIKNIEKTYYR